jgi:sialic acid synthase SpsE
MFQITRRRTSLPWIQEADIWACRPASGEFPAYDFDKLVGKRLNRAVTRNTQLKWEMWDEPDTS